MTKPDAQPLPKDEAKKLAALRTKLEILLNPEEADTIALIKAIDDIERCETLTERRAYDEQIVRIARRLLKAEWVRIKTELQ